MVGTNDSRDPRPAAERRDEVAAQRDDAAAARDAVSHTRDLEADERDQVSRTRNVEEAHRRNELLSRLLQLRKQIAERGQAQTTDPAVDPDDAASARGRDRDTGSLVLASDEVDALSVLVDNVIELLDASRQAGQDAASDRRSSASDRHAAEGDRWFSARDRAESAADRDQAAVDREQVDYRADTQSIMRRAKDAHDLRRFRRTTAGGPLRRRWPPLAARSSCSGSLTPWRGRAGRRPDGR